MSKFGFDTLVRKINLGEPQGCMHILGHVLESVQSFNFFLGILGALRVYGTMWLATGKGGEFKSMEIFWVTRAAG